MKTDQRLSRRVLAIAIAGILLSVLICWYGWRRDHTERVATIVPTASPSAFR